MNLIVAVDSAWGIGKDGRLLFRIREDMKRFRHLTVGKTIVFGRRTMETFPDGRPLADRNNIVMTRSASFPDEGIRACRSAEALFSIIRPIPKTDVFLIGGESVYRQFLPYCDTAFVTRVEGDFGADAFFPDLDTNPDWELTEIGEEMTDGTLKYRWSEYRNLHPKEIPT